MNLRRAMAGLHTWGGLLPSWLLFVIFFAGSLACFDKELERWMRPDLPVAAEATAASSLSLDQVRDWLLSKAPDAHALYIHGPAPRQPFWWAGYVPADEGEFQSFALDPVSGAPLQETVGGAFFFSLHYDLNAGTPGLYIVGMAAMFMLVALVSGIIIHRRIFKDFFTLRPGANGQRAWLDAHNLFGVTGLPFHLMIAYTGLAIFVSLYMPAGVQTAYRGDAMAFYGDAMSLFHREETHRPAAPAASLDALLADAQTRWGGAQPGWISVEHPADEAAVVEFRREGRTRVSDYQWTLAYDAASGELLHEQTPYAGGYYVYTWLSGLHMAQFGGHFVRFCYLLLGLAGCAMLVGGLRVWVSKREARGGRGLVLVRALNGAVVGGLPLASLALLYGNRLLPAQLVHRGRAETLVFFGAWALVAAWVVWRRHRLGNDRRMLALGSLLALGLPLLNLLLTPGNSLLASLPRGDWALAAIDLALLVVGLACGLLARRRPAAVPAPRRARRDALGEGA
ncbi:PepSY-associated TM helix domain-containing protein [Pseudomonas mangiferae]|uniref:PepSY domain-containing protein n=1 Tax=Pseudomonas mangiferae TaxID=2593654 RepID=A0A553H1A6_9PSED|nr:PepSY-associated TM helix domain-containing protein [Pseudomonas mangiferae]TRX75548.1 PepSY domain-containing protein [Pseudomonas mangiferae]